jgi:hypothetical protein
MNDKMMILMYDENFNLYFRCKILVWKCHWTDNLNNVDYHFSMKSTLSLKYHNIERHLKKILQ